MNGRFQQPSTTDSTDSIGLLGYDYEHLHEHTVKNPPNVLMECVDDGCTVHQNHLTRISSNRVHVALVLFVIAVQIFFVLHCCTVISTDCYRQQEELLVRNHSLLNQVVKQYKDIQEHSRVPTPFTNTIVENIQDRQTKRQMQLRNYCRHNRSTSPSKINDKTSANLLYSDIQGLIYCYVPKVACTNWKRMLQVFDGNIAHALEITDKKKVHRLKYSHLYRIPKHEQRWRKELYYSFLFVRHPFERLLSVYRNKFLDPYTPIFQRRYGAKILKMFRANLTREEYRMGKNITFREFVDFLITVYDTKGSKYFDEHWQITHTLCHPCSMKYNFIGKMDTLVEDSHQVLKELGLYGKVEFPVNATDKYKLNVQSLMKGYYSKLSKRTIKKLYEIYEDDFVPFGYEVPDYLS